MFLQQYLRATTHLQRLELAFQFLSQQFRNSGYLQLLEVPSSNEIVDNIMRYLLREIIWVDLRNGNLLK